MQVGSSLVLHDYSGKKNSVGMLQFGGFIVRSASIRILTILSDSQCRLAHIEISKGVVT